MKILHFWSRLHNLVKIPLVMILIVLGLLILTIIFLETHDYLSREEEKQLKYMFLHSGLFNKVLNRYYERYQKYPDSLTALTQVSVREVQLESEPLRFQLDKYKNPYRYFWNNTGLGNAYDDLEKYLPSLHSDTKGYYFLNDCNGKVLYQPMGKNNQDYILVGCVKDHRIYFQVYNSQGKSFGALIDTERKTIFYEKYYDEKIHQNIEYARY